MSMGLDELQSKMELWSSAWPKLVQGALRTGTRVLQDEIKRRWSGMVLQRRTGKLVNAVKTEVKLNPLTARVYVDSKQQYKAQTFEQGRTILPKHGQYLVIKTTDGFRKVRSVTIDARPVFKPSLEARNQEILDLIHSEIMKGYRNA